MPAIPKVLRSVGLNQVKGDGECIPCVAAMAVVPVIVQRDKEQIKAFQGRMRKTARLLAEARAEFVEFFPERDGYGDTDLMLWLLMHGYCMGAGYDKVSARTIQADPISIHTSAAYLSVESETAGGRTHAVYWDGIKIWDPNPESKGHRPHYSYNLIGWFPIYPAQVNGTIVKPRAEKTTPPATTESDNETSGDDSDADAAAKQLAGPSQN